jgi:hypothetical protein
MNRASSRGGADQSTVPVTGDTSLASTRAWVLKRVERPLSLAAGDVPVWVAASFDGDIVLIPAERVDEASALRRRAGRRVVG